MSESTIAPPGTTGSPGAIRSALDAPITVRLRLAFDYKPAASMIRELDSY